MGLKGEPEAVLSWIRISCGQGDSTARNAAPAPVETHRPRCACCVEACTADGFTNQLLQPGASGRSCHPEQCCAALPPLQMFTQQLGISVLDQHRLEQSIRKLQTSIRERHAQCIGAAPLAVLPAKDC